MRDKSVRYIGNFYNDPPTQEMMDNHQNQKIEDDTLYESFNSTETIPCVRQFMTSLYDTASKKRDSLLSILGIENCATFANLNPPTENHCVPPTPDNTPNDKKIDIGFNDVVDRFNNIIDSLMIDTNAPTYQNDSVKKVLPTRSDKRVPGKPKQTCVVKRLTSPVTMLDTEVNLVPVDTSIVDTIPVDTSTVDTIPVDTSAVNTIPIDISVINSADNEVTQIPESQTVFSLPAAILDTYMSVEPIHNIENDTSSHSNNNDNNYIKEMSEQEQNPHVGSPIESDAVSSTAVTQNIPILPDSPRGSEMTGVHDDMDDSLPKLTPADLLTNLKIVAQVKEGEKLLRNGNILNVDNRYFQFARRWYTEDNGDSTARFIEHLVASTKQHCTCLKEELAKCDNLDLQHQLTDFTLAIGNVKDGLENLKATYKDHTNVSIRVRLDTCVEDFHRIAESNVKLS
jgi:hypothetical protein